MQPKGIISENPEVLTWLLLSSCYLESQTSEKSAQRLCLHRFMNIPPLFFLVSWSLPRASRWLHTHPTSPVWWTKQSSVSRAEVCDTAHTTHMRGLAAAQGKQDDFEKQSYLHRPTLAQRKWNQFSSTDGSEMLSVAPAKYSPVPCKWLQDTWTLTLRPEHDEGPGQTALRGRSQQGTPRLSLLTGFSRSFKIKIITVPFSPAL